MADGVDVNGNLVKDLGNGGRAPASALAAVTAGALKMGSPTWLVITCTNANQNYSEAIPAGTKLCKFVSSDIAIVNVDEAITAPSGSAGSQTPGKGCPLNGSELDPIVLTPSGGDGRAYGRSPVAGATIYVGFLQS